MKDPGFDAVIFDLDGVITDTASVHSTAWTEMFDNYLNYRSGKYGEQHRPFDHEKDYLPYVDGKPRYKGVESFLESRDIELPYGDPSDPPDKETICGLGNRKNQQFNEILRRDGVKMYDSTVALLHELGKHHIKIGVASSSKNCKLVLETAGLLDKFETRVDGIVSAELGLSGKPEPDIFTTAADNLGVRYDRTVVIEDAVSGVMAGSRGNFGLVIGVARENNHEQLIEYGADIVVSDLKELDGINAIQEWFRSGLPEDQWSISFRGYNKDMEKIRETLLTVGNGYYGTRGALEEVNAGPHNYPGTYIAGLYNKRTTEIAGREIVNEDFVNVPDWTRIEFRIDSGYWVNPNMEETLSMYRKLDMKSGQLIRRWVVRDDQGRETELYTERFASMADMYKGGLRYSIKPLNYSGTLEVKILLDGNKINDGVARYRELDQLHLEHDKEEDHGDVNLLVVRTNQSGIRIAQAERLIVNYGGTGAKAERTKHIRPGKIETIFHLEIRQNEIFTLDRLVGIASSKEIKSEQEKFVLAKVDEKTNYDSEKQQSLKSWKKLWKKMDIELEGDRFAQKLLRLHIFHLLCTTSHFHTYLDLGIPARGLHGEAYRGHIFWDELFILPLYDLNMGPTARSVLNYRYRRLDKAREYAKENGYEGAMFPWQSGSDGTEESQVVHLNPISGEWGEDYSSLQRHISIAVAYNIWYFFWITQDVTFMHAKGLEMYLEICRFWSSKCEKDTETGRYHIYRVMGPDEFHEKYPGADHGGLKDNAYTNIMVAWLFEQAEEIINQLDEKEVKKVFKKISLGKDELSSWKEIGEKLTLDFSEEGIIAQFHGYFKLKELDWDYYRSKYPDIHRMDRILKAEGKSPDEYKVAKQADTLMTYYLLNEEEVRRIIEKMGYNYGKDFFRKHFDYYIRRTSHGSTLSRVVHAYLANKMGNRKIGWNLYMEALTSDYMDIQGGTTGEGIHAGVMGGTVMEVLTNFCGIDLHSDPLKIDPRLPEHWKKVRFGFTFRKNYYIFELYPDRFRLRVKARKPDSKKVSIIVRGKEHAIDPEQWNEIVLQS